MKLQYVEDRWSIVPPAVQAGLDEESQFEDFSIVKPEVGSGAYGVVHKVKHRASEKVFALKQLVKRQYMGEVPNCRHAVNLELQLNYRARHQFIARLHSHFEDQAKVYLLFQYVDGIDLFQCIQQESLSEAEAARVLFQLLEALSVLHGLNIIHRDIKPQNLLVTENGGIKLIDLGVSNLEGANRKTLCGTDEYLAPESIRKEGQSCKVDVWAVGVLLFEMLVGCTPFKDSEDLVQENILKGKMTTPYPESISVQARNFIKAALRQNPQDRPSVLDLLSHSFLQGHLSQRTIPQPLRPLSLGFSFSQNSSKLARFSEEELRQILSQEDIIKRGAFSSVRQKELLQQNQHMQRQIQQIRAEITACSSALPKQKSKKRPCQIKKSQFQSLLKQLQSMNDIQNRLSLENINLKRLQKQREKLTRQNEVAKEQLRRRDQTIQRYEGLLIDKGVEFEQL